MIPAQEALARLREGNLRFVAGANLLDTTNLAHADMSAGQNPIAVVLGCSDSRVPVEVIFDQGLGDLFVIRVAGNIVAPSQVGSVEFAAALFSTRLVVVLGHTGCGAIDATLDDLLQGPDRNHSANIRSIVDRIRPSVEDLVLTEPKRDRASLARQAVRANVRHSANHLRHGSAILEDLIERDGLTIVGAEYSLETGLVDFFDGVQRPADK